MFLRGLCRDVITKGQDQPMGSFVRESVYTGLEQEAEKQPMLSRYQETSSNRLTPLDCVL
jgi:hypothetical protein